MWKEFLLSYGIFLVEILTLILAVFFVVVVLFNLKKQQQSKGELQLTNLNDKYKGLTQKLSYFRLNPAEVKRLEKAEKKAKKAQEKADHTKDKACVYVLNFKGDIAANQVTSLREELNAILTTAVAGKDEILLKLESSGGMVHAYGLAASQLQRIKQKGVKLRIVIDKVAASGGYMMACIADEIIAAPFAILGSIGVVANVPNIHRLLKKNDIDVDVMTAGEYKRTVTLLGEKTEKGTEKLQSELEETHLLFKQFVQQHRPKLDIEKIATGEHWFGIMAEQLQLVDKIATSDDIILEYLQQNDIDIIEVSFSKKKSLLQKLGKQTESSVHNVLTDLINQKNIYF